MVAFGDVNLAEEPIGGPYQAGAGGWPTIRYFNAATGKGGAPYEKKTDRSMCEELGDVALMRDYVTGAGMTSACDLATGEECSEKETEYKAKNAGKSAAELAEQLEGLAKKAAGRMKPSLREWLGQRMNVLSQLRAAATAKEEL